MAVPSRAFVGILVFALLATLAIVPYTLLILSGYRPPVDAPHELLFPEPGQTGSGTKIVLVIASGFCIALLVSAWRGLLHGARADRRLREERAKRPAGATPRKAPRPEVTASGAASEPTPPPGVTTREEPPPGYH